MCLSVRSAVCSFHKNMVTGQNLYFCLGLIAIGLNNKSQQTGPKNVITGTQTDRKLMKHTPRFSMCTVVVNKRETITQCEVLHANT